MNPLKNPAFEAKEFLPYQSLIEEINLLLSERPENKPSKKPFLVAIDGKCTSGKTTLALYLSTIYDCNVISLDDFFLPVELRTKERYLKTGGNVHYERFLNEVLEPLSCHKKVNYGVFDCSVMNITTTRDLPEKNLYIIEGSYSLRPDFIKYYDLSVILTVSEEIQKDRLLKRNGPVMYKNFKNKWIPLENQYFQQHPEKNATHLLVF